MTKTPTLNHIGFIMDGNRRWAKAQGLPTLEGHRRGYEKWKEVGEWCLRRGIPNITVYAFSTENWNRTKEEVNYLMGLLEHALSTELNRFLDQGIRVRVIGRRDGLPAGVVRAIQTAEERTQGGERGTQYVALNYGGRAEIIDAVKKMLEENVTPDQVDEVFFKKYLYAAKAPEPDLIVRTSGEQRTSGFLLWQAAYSELYFTPTHWPAFSETDLEGAIQWYTERQRRFGV